MTAPPTATRVRLSALLTEARDDLLASFQGLTDEQMDSALREGWSVKDILAHLAMWEEIALLDMCRVARGDRAALDAWDHSFNNEWNHIQFALRKGFPLPQVITELAEVRRGTIELVGSVPEERLVGGFIPSTCAIHARHDREHAEQIREWRQKENI